MRFPSSILAALAILSGCTADPQPEPTAKNESGATASENAEATPFAGAWEFEGDCTSNGASADCDVFARINSIPKAMHFYDQGRKAAIIHLQFGETDPKGPAMGTVTEADPLTWPAFAAASDGELSIGTTSSSIPYRVRLSGSKLTYCFDSAKACALLVKKGNAAKSLEDRVARYERDLRPTKHGNVAYACDERDPDGTGSCTEHMFDSALAYFPFDEKRCGTSGREVRTCPPEAKKSGCRSTYFGVSYIIWWPNTVEPSDYCEAVQP